MLREFYEIRYLFGESFDFIARHITFASGLLQPVFNVINDFLDSILACRVQLLFTVRVQDAQWTEVVFQDLVEVLLAGANLVERTLL